jgi:hypothetical protein
MTEITEANEFEVKLLMNYGNLSCNESAFRYARDNPNATVYVGEMQNGQVHCWAYDPERDLTIDVSPNGVGINPSYWEGAEHPHSRDIWGTFSAATEDEFKEEFAGCPTFVI